MTRSGRGRSRSPKFETYEAEAEFWDSHDSTEFEDELEPARVRVAKPLRITYTMRLEPEVVQHLKRLSRATGTDASALAHMWIVERLAQEQGRAAASLASTADS